MTLADLPAAPSHSVLTRICFEDLDPADVLGVMAVAGATWPCDRWGGRYVVSWEPQVLAGPHTFEVVGLPQIRILVAEDVDFRARVAHRAYRAAQNRRDAGALHDAIKHGPAWPLSNLRVL